MAAAFQLMFIFQLIRLLGAFSDDSLSAAQGSRLKLWGNIPKSGNFTQENELIYLFTKQIGWRRNSRYLNALKNAGEATFYCGKKGGSETKDYPLILVIEPQRLYVNAHCHSDSFSSTEITMQLSKRFHALKESTP